MNCLFRELSGVHLSTDASCGDIKRSGSEPDRWAASSNIHGTCPSEVLDELHGHAASDKEVRTQTVTTLQLLPTDSLKNWGDRKTVGF